MFDDDFIDALRYTLFGIKGGNMQTEIDYKEVGDRIEFVAFRNVLNLTEIGDELGGKGGDKFSGYTEYIGGGRAFYALFDNDTTTLRTYSEKEINPRDAAWAEHYKDYTIGAQYTQKAWVKFIEWLRDAGERFTTIKQNKQRIHTITI